ncbi:MAG: lipoate--protein ligase family protein, partial [Longimicrobiales bacterium]
QNMARDHGLAMCSKPGVGTLRLYRWSSPTVSFGRNEPTASYQKVQGETLDVAFVRRPTGGRAVLHDGELTYGLVFPRGALGGLKESYRTIQKGLVASLAELGVPASQSPGGPPLAPGAGPCFAAAAPGEVVVDGRKVAGSAQARIGRAVLQHGSLLTESDQRRLEELVPGAAATNAAPPVTLKEILGRTPPWDVLVDALVVGMSSVLHQALEPSGLTVNEVEAEERLQGHYESPDWTWRR